jgi:hypothetical protein
MAVFGLIKPNHAIDPAVRDGHALPSGFANGPEQHWSIGDLIRNYAW